MDRGGGDVSSMLCSICCSFHPGGERAFAALLRSSFAKQSGSEGSRASQSVWELAGEHFNHVARPWERPSLAGCAQLSLLLPGLGESSAPLAPRALHPAALPGAGALAQLAVPPQELAVPSQELFVPPQAP